MKKYLLLFFVSMCSICVSQDSWAGARTVSTVSVDTVSRVASGSLGSARASADNNQYIGCYLAVSNSGSTVIMNCSANTANNVYASCSKSAPSAALLNALTSISEISYIYFAWDATNTCTSLYVTNSSRNYPVIP